MAYYIQQSNKLFVCVFFVYVYGNIISTYYINLTIYKGDQKIIYPRK